MYDFGQVKVFAGYEHIQYANPRTPLPAGFNDIGGYVLAFVNTSRRFAPTPKTSAGVLGGREVHGRLEARPGTASYYGYHQNSFATGANAGCSTNKSGTAAAPRMPFGVSADYRWTKRFDTYAGMMYTGVKDGLANGFNNTSTIDPTIGVRFKF